MKTDPAPMRPRILVVDDDPDLLAGLEHNLALDGFLVDSARDGDEALHKLRAGGHDLIVLDLMMPRVGGIDVLRAMRAEGMKTPVIVLSAKNADRDKIRGLELGADDYVTKPFGVEELEARIRAVLRRSQSGAATGGRDIWRFPDLVVDFRRFTATRDGVEHQLSRYEAEILRMLIARRGQVVTRRELLTEVWGYTHVPNTRTVDNHVARLRKKIEQDVDAPVHVVTVHGLGYRFDSEPTES
ncbi:MAG: response regulator transcription factor [Planctomycetes bacterium]|nr:response regulator transcription factor [Planctomycetota bacterium]